MCGRYASARSSDVLAEQYDAIDAAGTGGGRFNIAPTDVAPVVVAHDGAPVVRALRWGLVPPWAEDPRLGARLINARAETAADKPAFRSALRRRRCLVPADAYYEWVRDGGGRQPFALEAEGRAPLTFAGLYEWWRDPGTGEPLASYAIVTRAAGPDTRSIHDRAPVLVTPADWPAWLDPTLRQPDSLLQDLAAAPSRLIPRAVPRLVNDVRADGPALLADAELATQLALLDG